ncbi:hypothetical protein R1sor_021187 [Riccia sorocarpa]|uniref:Uncharacterized protein n=1 Tax=Riccia sorocarpa TaxID=122646 RepID=A0ABD3GHU1_9MARC
MVSVVMLPSVKRKRVAGTALTAKEMQQLQLSQFVTSVHPGRRPQVLKIEPSVTGGKWVVVGGLLTKALTITCANVKQWYDIWTLSAILYCYEEVMKRNRSLSLFV